MTRAVFHHVLEWSCHKRGEDTVYPECCNERPVIQSKHGVNQSDKMTGTSVILCTRDIYGMDDSFWMLWLSTQSTVASRGKEDGKLRLIGRG